MTMKTSAAIIMAGLISACSQMPGGDVEKAKIIVRETLIDGQSAQFENVVVQKGAASGADPVVCGWVNAKNRMGGYTGSEKFIVKPGVSVFYSDGEGNWFTDFAECVTGSENKAAYDRLIRDGMRAIDGLSEASEPSH